MSKKADIQRYFESFGRTDRIRTVHMCLNSDCFYCETIMPVTDLVWKQAWDTTTQDLAPYPTCPSCGEVSWREVWTPSEWEEVFDGTNET